MSENVRNFIKQNIDNNDICLCMKGNPEVPQGGFSLAVANILRLPEPPQPTDVADALAIAITAALRNDLKNTM